MPLDGHSYLVSQGWGGKGTGLREGAISRPIAVAQKKNLAGLGKDRDEAFPFWDHLYSAAAKSIVVKCLSDDEDSEAEAESSSGVTLKRTSTGILSTHRPVDGTPASSGTATPTTADESTHRLSLMANAKRDAARRGLYSRFFKGPVIGPETIAAEEKRLAALVSEALAKQNPEVESVSVSEHIEIKTAHEVVSVDLEVSKSHSKKKKGSTKAVEQSSSEDEEAARKERKRRRKEKRKEKEKEKEMAQPCEKEHKKKSRTKEVKNLEEAPSTPNDTKREESDDNEESRAAKKKRKEEKRRLKALHKEKDPDAVPERISSQDESAPLSKFSKHDNKEKKRKRKKSDDVIVTSESNLSAAAPDQEGEERKRKKKRKRDDDSR